MVVLRCGLRSQAPGSNHQVIPTSIVMSFREVTNARALAQSLACGRCSINAGDKSEWKGSYIQAEEEQLLKDFTDHEVSCFLFDKTQHLKISHENGM